MKTRIALSALALAVLAGCGGGGPEGPAAPSTNETSRVIAFGDSLTDGGAYSRGNSLLLQAPPPQGGGVPAALANQVGKFTNSPGDNWVEVLAKKLGTTIAPERFEMGSAQPGGRQQRRQHGGQRHQLRPRRLARGAGAGRRLLPAGTRTADRPVQQRRPPCP
jgi:outer membrane lipase/esterase